MPVRLWAGLEIKLLDRFPANSHQTYQLCHLNMHSDSSRLSRASRAQGEPRSGIHACCLNFNISNYYRENVYYNVLLSISEFTWNSCNIPIIISWYTLNPSPDALRQTSLQFKNSLYRLYRLVRFIFQANQRVR